MNKILICFTLTLSFLFSNVIDERELSLFPQMPINSSISTYYNCKGSFLWKKKDFRKEALSFLRDMNYDLRGVKFSNLDNSVYTGSFFYDVGIINFIVNPLEKKVLVGFISYDLSEDWDIIHTSLEYFLESERSEFLILNGENK